MRRPRAVSRPLAVLIAYALVVQALLAAGAPLATSVTGEPHAWCSEVGAPAPVPGQPDRRTHDCAACCLAAGRTADPLSLPPVGPELLSLAVAGVAAGPRAALAPRARFRSAAPLPPRGPPLPA